MRYNRPPPTGGGANLFVFWSVLAFELLEDLFVQFNQSFELFVYSFRAGDDLSINEEKNDCCHAAQGDKCDDFQNGFNVFNHDSVASIQYQVSLRLRSGQAATSILFRASSNEYPFDYAQDRPHRDQCLKCRLPVKTMAIPCLSAVAMTSPSFFEPPG